jgi:beta-lactamase class A
MNLKANLTKILSELANDSFSLKVKFIKTGLEFDFNAESQFWAASVIKVPIACTAYKLAQEGTLNLNKRVSINEENRVLGAGVLKLLESETQFSIKELLVLMLTLSDNSATNQLVDEIGWEKVEEYMVSLGLTNTTFRHKMMIPAGRGPNLTTAQDMCLLMEKLYPNKLLGSSEIINLMSEQIDRSRIPLYIPNEIQIAHKFGALPQATHEIGIVYSKNPFIFCFFSDDQTDKLKTNEVLAQCAKLCFDYSELENTT